uniref:Uncharacterized protein n=1 Tax=Anopheles dirus TaxID=7168 RepID=A0A182NX24_9DIPT
MVVVIFEENRTSTQSTASEAHANRSLAE